MHFQKQGFVSDANGNVLLAEPSHFWVDPDLVPKRRYTNPTSRGSGSGNIAKNMSSGLGDADKEVDEQYYLLWRLEEGVPEGSAEIPKGEAIPLEYNLAGLNAISFEKGCYVGQESVARTYHRGVIRKRLLPVNFIHDSGEEVQQAVAPKSEIIEVNSGKKVGTVTTVLGSRGLALLRLEAALKNTSQLNVKGLENVNVKVIRPKWWPSEWGREEEQAAAVA